MSNLDTRRDLIRSAGAAFTTSIFTGSVKGANDRVTIAHIGMGVMGMGNLRYAMNQPNLVVKAVCDVYGPNLERAVAATKNQAKGVKDFRAIIADKSIDAVCISTPDHWHAYMTVEACKAGKDVYVEKPVCKTVEEGVKMVQAARKYGRVVQAGTMQRSGPHFQKACEIVRSGKLGKITFVRTWNYSNLDPAGIGNPPDETPPAGLDWALWQGPAPLRPFNRNRCGRPVAPLALFHWFWDYGGGMVTNWGVHWIDIVQMAFDETMPKSISAHGSKFFLQDNRETPDTTQVTYEYPGFLATYEHRNGTAESLFGRKQGILFCGTKGTMFLDRPGYEVFPEKDSGLPEMKERAAGSMNANHWANFLECVRTREKPASDIEKCQRATTTCLLGNVALRSGLRIDWDPRNWTIRQPEARQFLSRQERAPWRIVV